MKLYCHTCYKVTKAVDITVSPSGDPKFSVLDIATGKCVECGNLVSKMVKRGETH
jgi:hypothetical protein